MTKILLGPAGTPAKNTFEGVSKIKELGLQAMEVQFSHGMNMSETLAKKIGEEQKRIGTRLSVHAPYYINLASEDKKKREESKKRIINSCDRAHLMGASPVVFHPAYFGKHEKERVFQMAKEAIDDIMKIIKKNGWKVQLAPETTGKHSALGSLDETIHLVKETKCSMCVDFAHLYARNYGKINYAEILDKVSKLKINHLHCHFSNINYTSKGEQNHMNLDHQPDFTPLAKELIKRRKPEAITIICESPITWKDSLKMRQILERVGYKFE